MRGMKRIAIVPLLLASTATQAADTTTIRITRSDCVQLVEHVPSDDVAYRPGVDVRGKQVAPADVAGTPDLRNIVPEVLEFPIALNPLKGGAARFGETSLEVGTVKFDMKSRRATFNGESLTRRETRLLAKECREVIRKR